MTLFDAIAGGVLLISALLGLARGATREVTTFLSFALALAVALLAARLTTPLAAQVIHIRWMATAAAILVVFILAYILFRTLGGALTAGVRDAGFSGLDKALGFAIGLGRGLLVMGAAALLIGAAVPAEQMPGWIARARLYPLARDAGAAIKAVAPRGLEITHDLAPVLAQSGTSLASDAGHRPGRLTVAVETPP
jgi:membrane protein required for colicin V production